MKYVAVSIFDLKVGAFSPPFFTRSKGEAIRGFNDACKDPKMAFHAHPEDYVLHFVGSFDDASGVFSHELPVRMIAGNEFDTGSRQPEFGDLTSATAENVERLRTQLDGGGG